MAVSEAHPRRHRQEELRSGVALLVESIVLVRVKGELKKLYLILFGGSLPQAERQ